MLIRFFSEIEVNSGRIFTDMRSMKANLLKSHYSPSLLIVNYYTHKSLDNGNGAL